MQRYELIKSTNYAMFSGLPMIAALPMFAVYTLGMGEVFVDIYGCIVNVLREIM
jgi:hypothetical protein